jgi:hypothetical protein
MLRRYRKCEARHFAVANPLHQGRHMRMRVLLVCCSLLGCASRYRAEFVGTGNALVTTRGATAPTDVVAAPGGGGMQLPRGSYEVALRFDIPRAQIINWRVSCPGTEREGAVGESYEAYRDRRLAELRTMYERDRRRAEAATNLVVGVVAPRVRGETRVVTPGGTVVVRGETRVTRTVDAPPPPIVEPVPGPEPGPEIVLSPLDTGRGTLGAKIRIDTTSDGVCSVIATADDTIVASYAVTRVRDLVGEERERKLAVTSGAFEVRTRVRAQLVTYGADEGARQRRRQAEARLRAEAEATRQRRLDAEARVRAEAEARRGLEARLRIEAELRASHEADLRARAEAHAEAERTRLRLEAEARVRWEAEAPLRARAELVARQRAMAFTTREYVIAWLVGRCNADPGRRARIAEQQRIERAERERLIAVRLEAERAERAERERLIAVRLEAEHAERERLRAEADARAALEVARLAELGRRRTEHALQVRTQLTGYLVSIGARLRPPRPEPQHEEPGAEPFPGARWIAGSWEWTDARWIWRAGGWTDPHTFGDAGGEVIVKTDGHHGGYGGGHTGVLIAPPTITTTTVHVHTPPVRVHAPPVIVRTPPVVVRDHRDRTPPPPVVRDHRHRDRTPPPVVRDHRDRTPPPVVRDHRRDREQDDKTVRDHRRR